MDIVRRFMRNKSVLVVSSVLVRPGAVPSCPVISEITRRRLAVCLSAADPICRRVKPCTAIGQSFSHNESVATSATRPSFIVIRTKT